MSKECNWYCLLLDGQTLRGKNKENISKEINKIFGKDLINLVILDNEFTDTFDSLSENYIFVCCSNYDSHINRLKKSDLVSLVLPSFENPSIVHNDEVSKFIKSTEEDKNENKVELGSIVLVNNNYLENLFGVVKKIYSREEKCDVVFRLYTKTFTKKLSMNNLTSVDSFFKYVKFPVCHPIKVTRLSKKIDNETRKKILKNK